MRTITIIALTASIFASLPAAAQATDWTPIPVPEWSAPGMVDRIDQKRTDATITSWFRFVDAPGRPPAEEDPEVVDALRDGSHADLRASVDCSGKRFRVEGTRIVLPDETIEDVGYVPEAEAFWVPIDTTGHARPSAVFAALCRADGTLR